MTLARVFVVLTVVCLLLVQSASASYVGAVMEHTVYVGADDESSSSKLSKNLDIYEQAVSAAAKQGVQVLVFPEFGLTPSAMDKRSDLYPYIEVIPEVSANVTPCDDANFADRPILQRMSCAAKKNKQLILVNMIDNVVCSPASDSKCPSDGHYQYNTDVIFNEQGKLDAKYHKSHEIKSLQAAYDVAPTTEVSYKASFGVEFGLFICYDIMFEDPPKVLRSRGIQHFLYAVAQYEIGEKTIIEGWSRNNNATVLSANLGSGGRQDCSGLIVNGAALEAKKINVRSKDFPNDNILVATVPTD